ncbi:FUSC family protein [Xanthomonas arboricola]|uniref:FUSC family protein n=1 Tax=Xanthomonas arboricola TaxID=56448 RepID=UPI001EE906D3|nr:FUSC family protein [Xanthomonas arboricola]
MAFEGLSIPTVVWSGIIAAAISLAGVLLSNWSTSRRLRMQLQHDAAEKLKDRLGSLRKEVYLQLYSDITALQGHLGALSAKDPTSPEFAAPIQAVISQLARVQLVGGSEVMKQADELSASFTESLFHLMAAAKPMHELKSEIGIADQFYNQNMQELQRINAEMMAQNESGHPDTSRMAALQRSFDHFHFQYSTHRQERDQAWESHNALHVQFLDVVKTQVQYMEPAQARLMAALKNEIGVTTDVTELLNQIEVRQQRIEAAVDGLLPIFSDFKVK